MKRLRFTTDQLNEKVLAAILAENPTKQNRISKATIAIKVYGHYNPSIDRSVRDAVTELTINGNPICATSDAKGYYLARTYEEAEQCIAELRSRSAVYDQKIEGIKRGLLNQKQVVKEPVQMGLGLGA